MLRKAHVLAGAVILFGATGLQAGDNQNRDAKKPNILFIIFDDWGWRHAGAYGCGWVKTPNFDRVAREGVLFKNAFTSNPKCSPCRASILTGRNTWQLEEAACHFGIFPAKFAVYPDLLEKNGYAVGLTGKGWGPGDFKSTGFKRNPAGPSFDQHKIEPPTSAIGRNDYAKNFEAFLSQRAKDKPFCFWMGFAEPHRPFELNSGIRLGKKPADVAVPSYLPDTPTVRGDLADYAIEVEYADAHIGRTLDILKASGELERTLIVITSDHGIPFPYVKGQIHEDGFHLPLAMRWGEGIKPGRVVEDFINVSDFAPTFLELAGVAQHAQMRGKSLANILRSEKSGWIENRDVMLVGKERHDIGRPNDWGYPVRAIRTKDFLYVHNFHPERWPACNPETDFGNCDPGPTKELIKALGGHFFELSFGKRLPDELYRLSDDPEGVRNLANDLAFKETADKLRQRMMRMLRDEGDPRALGKGDIFDTYKYTGRRQGAYETWLSAQEQKAAAPARAADKGLEIHFIDVEGGAATLIVTPAGESVLIDCGNPGKRDAERIHRAASAAGLKAIDNLVITHWHVDHYGGAERLSQLMPVRNFYDRGIPEKLAEDPANFPLLIQAYRMASKGKSKTLKAGDEVPLKTASVPLRLKCICASGEVIPDPPDALPNPVAAEHRPHPDDPTDNAKSLGFVLEYGAFRFLDLGDLTWNIEYKLVHPADKIGPIDVYLSTHHGLEVSNNPVVLKTVKPRVAIFNNGPRKGGHPSVISTLRRIPEVQAIYQLHRNVQVSAQENTDPEFIANSDEKCQAEPIKLAVAADGKSYQVTVGSKGKTRQYQTRSPKQ